MKIQYNAFYRPSFNSGLTEDIKRSVSAVNTAELESQWQKYYKVGTDFANNKSLAACFTFVMSLCQEAYLKYSLPFAYLPPKIRIFKPERLEEHMNKACLGFCITDTDKILKDEPPIELCSIFYRNLLDDITYLNILAEKDYQFQRASSNNFLSSMMHEWFHNIHLNLIFYKRGYESNCAYGQEVYKNIKIPKKEGLKRINFLIHDEITNSEKKQIEKSLGQYAYKTRMELFSESMVKLMTDVIAPDTMSLKQNPLDNLKKMPKFIQKFIKQEIE